MKGKNANTSALIICKVERITKLVTEEEPLRKRTPEELIKIGDILMEKVYGNTFKEKQKIINKLANNQEEWLKHFESKDILTEKDYEKIKTNFVYSDSDMESLIDRAFDECNRVIQRPSGDIDCTPQTCQIIKKIFIRNCVNKIHIICDESNNNNNAYDHKIAIANIYYFYQNHIVSKELIFGTEQNILQYKTSLII
jgi:hypothetical protein